MIKVRRSYTLLLTSFLLLVFFASCCFSVNEDYAVGENPVENSIKAKQAQMSNSLASANKIISDREKQRIEAFIDRRGWQTEEISGVYIQTIRQGKKKIPANALVTIKYKSYYLNGESAEDFNRNENEKSVGFSNNTPQKSHNQKTFSLQGDTYVVYGLIYAIRNLNQGAYARVIVPDNLAFYMNDNGEKIKVNATLVYEVEILNVR